VRRAIDFPAKLSQFSGMSDDEQKRLDTIHNERVKLMATWMNNVGVGCVIAGFLAPSIGAAALELPKAAWLILAQMIWIPIGVALHFMGRRILGGLR
jgi:hypothetical protein